MGSTRTGVPKKLREAYGNSGERIFHAPAAEYAKTLLAAAFDLGGETGSL